MTETTSYRIKTYEEGFSDPEIELVKDYQARNSLPSQFLWFPTQNAIDQFKANRDPENENSNFTASDHHYLFNGDEMVAFIHAYPQQNTKRYGLSIIPSKKGHENEAKKLFNLVLDDAKTRGYEVLVKNASDNHPLDIAFLKENGFEKIRLRNMRAHISLNELNVEPNDEYELETFNAEKHQEKIINDLYLTKGYPREQIETQFTNMKQLYENGGIPSWVVATKDGEIIGQSLAFFGNPDLPVVQFNTVTTNLKGDAALPLINAIYSKHLTVLPDNITHLDHYLFAQVSEERSTYEKLGFKYNENYLYERKIQ